MNMRILGWGFILFGIFDFLSSLIGFNLTPFIPQGLSKFTPLIFGFIGSLLLKIKLERKIDVNKKKEIFNKFKKKIEQSKHLIKQKKFLNKKNIYLISFFFIFTIAFAGYYVYQGNINEKLIAKKIEEERIEKNKKDFIEILNNSKRLEEAKKKASDTVTSDFINAIKESREARNYCDQIHSQPSLRIFLEREECAWSEKIRIFRKYNVDYDRTIEIINREYEELENIARNASQNIILGNRFNREEHAKRVTLVRQRATDQLLYEKDRFIEKLISKLEKDLIPSLTNKTKKSGSGSAFFINKKGYIPICFIMKFSKSTTIAEKPDVTIITDAGLTCEIFFKNSISDIQKTGNKILNFKEGKAEFKPVRGGARHAMVRLYNPVPERKTDYYNYE